MKRHAVFVAALLVAGAAGHPAFASDLFGSRGSMEKQHSVAVDLDYDFARSASEVAEVVASGVLEEVVPNADFSMSGVSFPYAQPVVRDFVGRLAAEYHFATGQPLVVTSLTRPLSEQPANASPLSVHPAGMAVDLRIPLNRKAEAWLAMRLLDLESRGVLDVTLERHPPHLHVAVYPEPYKSYAAAQDRLVAQRTAQRAVRVVVTAVVPTSVAATTTRASADWLFPALTAGMLLSLVAAFSRKSAKAFARLSLRRRQAGEKNKLIS